MSDGQDDLNAARAKDLNAVRDGQNLVLLSEMIKIGWCKNNSPSPLYTSLTRVSLLNSSLLCHVSC